MSAIDFFRGFLRTKDPTFNITDSVEWTDYSYLIGTKNYLDNYIGWTYKSSNLIARTVAMYPLELYKKDGDESKKVTEKDREYEIIADLTRFNSHQNLYEARVLKILHKKLTGMAFWYREFYNSSNGKRNEFYPLNPTRLRALPNKITGLPEFYVYSTPSGQEQIIPAKEVIILKEANPKDWTVGYSPLDASALPHDTWEEASKFHYNFIKNGARPQGILQLIGVSEDERKRVEKQLKSRYQGAKNAGRVMVARSSKDAEIKFQDLTKVGKDLEFNEGILRMRDEILALMGAGVKDILVGGSTYNNMGESQRIFQQYTILPELIEEAESLNEQLISLYKNKFDTSKLFFKPANPVEKDSAKESQIITTEYQGGIITRNEARQKRGYDAVENGDMFADEIQSEKLIERLREISNDKDKENISDEMKRAKGIKKKCILTGISFEQNS